MVVLKELIFKFLCWEGVVVMKELIFNSFHFGRVRWSWKNWFFSFYFGRVWWSWKNWFLTLSPLGNCGGHERTDFFLQFLLWACVVVLKELIFNTFSFGQVWWSWKNWFFYSFYFGLVWWSWKNSILTVSTLGGCGGLERTHF